MTINDDDDPPTVTFTAASQASTFETGLMTITAQLSSASAFDVIVPVSVNTSSTAAYGADYTVDSLRLIIPAGSVNAEMDIIINNDVIDENNETVIIDIGTPVNATPGAITQHTATITDDDTAPWVEFMMGSSSDQESNSPAMVLTDLSALSSNDISVDYYISGGTADGGGIDYTLASGTLTIPAGSWGKNISIPINNDMFEESNETIIITLTNPANATLGTILNHTYTINDDDSIKVQFNSNFTFASEQDGLTLVQVDLNTVSAANVSVDYSVTGGTAIGGGVDYTLSSGTLTIPAGINTGYIYVYINDDSDEEPSEYIYLALSNPSGASLGWDTSQEIMIDDNDTPWLDSQWSHRKKIYIIDKSGEWHNESLMPVADVAGQINIPYSSGGGAHWTEVDEMPSDGGTTVVFVTNGTPGSDFRDLYELENKTITGQIKSVRLKCYIYIDIPALGNARLAIKPSGSAIVYESGDLNPSSGWGMYEYEWKTNPFTGTAWTQSDIDSLQAGITLVENGTYISCSMVNVEVDYLTGADLVNYQVNIGLSVDNFEFSDARTNGEDIRFTQYDFPLQNQIFYWLENYNSGMETASIWAEVPNIPCNGFAILYMYYGNAAASSESDFTNTFTKDYGESGLAALWHMDDGMFPTDDTSGNNNHASFTGGPLWTGMDGGQWADRPDISFAAGNSLDFAGSDTEYIFAPDSLSLDITDKITLEAWMTGTSANPGTATEILRPNAPGDQTSILHQTANPHWAAVDETSHDGNATCIYVSNADALTSFRDLYNLPDCALSGSINSVKVYCTISAANLASQIAKTAIKTNGSIFESYEFYPGTSYTTESYTWNINPSTGLAWTWSEINNLQAGVTLTKGSPPEYIYCTQVYVEVNYNTGNTDSLLIFKPDAYALGINASNNLFADINKTARVEALLADPSTEWHHVAMTYNGSELLLYADGLEVSRAPYIISISANADPVILGYYFNGQIDEARIYNRALSADEINTHYERRKYSGREPEIYIVGD
jgi:hypothetical protein